MTHFGNQTTDSPLKTHITPFRSHLICLHNPNCLPPTVAHQDC
jgi:hypothetical protein